MEVKACISDLKSTGAIPEDSEVVSTNNKIVVISRSTKTVSRIANFSDIQERDDPHDIRYSHSVAWYLSESAPVVRPTAIQPTVIGDYIVSSYPLLDSDHVDLSAPNAANIFFLIRRIGDALPDVMANISLRTLSVSSYVADRINYLSDNPGGLQDRVEILSSQFDEMEDNFSFDELAEADIALVHGDFKAQNVVSDRRGQLVAIDLDAASIGPRLFDLASWRLRAELGDRAAIEEAVEVGRDTTGWEEDAFRALIGWKALSSMSFTLRYEPPDIAQNNFDNILKAALRLGGLAAKG